ncbi:hypothetical protein F5Y15DRAFT_411408 [Xylariaceae sp. FL0016]|nr:hypothetical protein F5Y15DRAFT_411408 [Xylariaceae sp. FL0016]
MCLYRKTLWSCNHSQLSSEPITICSFQKAYLAGKATEPCDITETHGRSTIRLAKLCAHHEEKNGALGQKFEHVKACMAELRKHLDENYENVMKHLDEVGLEPEPKPGNRTAKTLEKVDPAAEFLRKKMAEKDSHLMMFSA